MAIDSQKELLFIIGISLNARVLYQDVANLGHKIVLAIVTTILVILIDVGTEFTFPFNSMNWSQPTADEVGAFFYHVALRLALIIGAAIITGIAFGIIFRVFEMSFIKYALKGYTFSVIIYCVFAICVAVFTSIDIQKSENLLNSSDNLIRNPNYSIRFEQISSDAEKMLTEQEQEEGQEETISEPLKINL